MKKCIAVATAVAIIAGAGGFYGGVTYQKTQASNVAQNGFGPGQFGNRMMGPNGFRGQNDANGRFPGQGPQGIGRPVAGEILEKDNSSVTIKMQDGSTKIIILSKSATIRKSSIGSLSDLKKGERIMVIGTENSDGSLTASNIQVGDIGFGRFGQQRQPNVKTN